MKISNEVKYHLITFGCQMNKSDSEKISCLLEDLGYIKTDKPDEADFIILNSCSVRQSAEDRIFGQINNFSKLKEKNPNLVLAVTGCMPGRDVKEKFKKKMPAIDLYFPISELENLPFLLSNFASKSDGHSCENKGDKKSNKNKEIALVPIQTGCNRFCSYCVVPYARGREKCRSIREILSEIKNRAKNGYDRVELLGQVVNNYIAPDQKNFSNKNPYKNHFAALLWEINQVSNVRKVNFISAHPIHMTDEIIDALTLPKQLNYLHLAVQSGDNEILRKMNRLYTREEYLEIIKKIKEKKPDITLGTDIIVGFPGEGEREFQNTIELCREVDFEIIYTSMYSPRSGTIAYNFKNDVLREEKKKRWNEIQKLIKNTYTNIWINFQK